jgi:hypothetical protein
MLPKSIYAYGYVALRNLNANPVLVSTDQMEFLFFQIDQHLIMLLLP